MIKATLIDNMGSDDRVVDAARVSFSKIAENYTQEQNGRLIKFLAKHKHWTPFSHPQLTFLYEVPVFVARQEFKHIIGFTRNEVSRRYVDDPPQLHTPSAWRLRPDKSIKQGSGDVAPNITQITANAALKSAHDTALSAYNTLIENGIAPEQARMVLPQSMMTSYYITGSLAAFARFYTQRIDSTAQLEIQELAKAVGSLIAPLYPISWRAMTNDS